MHGRGGRGDVAARGIVWWPQVSAQDDVGKAHEKNTLKGEMSIGKMSRDVGADL
jgi:hypothetical protein